MTLSAILIFVIATGWASPLMILAGQPACAPTVGDMEGPFYKPNAPERSKTGNGLVVRGVVRSAHDCAPLSGARIEWWQANTKGSYDEAHRATMRAGKDGSYRYESDFPPPYSGRPSHIHVKVFAPGHRLLTTQIYPKEGQREIVFDFVIRPQ
ncbi:MAG: intradiol ring-cleavage dioxygenase [Candidatus Binatia bacterium]